MFKDFSFEDRGSLWFNTECKPIFEARQGNKMIRRPCSISTKS